MSASELNARQRFIWSLFDFDHGRGLEIGPLHHACVPRDLADVRYLDVFDRDQLIAHYAADVNVPAELIPEMDYVLSDGTTVRSIPESIGDDVRFDWVMASHVVEHVPDAIGWLDQIADVVVDGGALVLAVPDRRYCFDLHRPGTSLGQMLQAHELKETVPSIRAVYDYKRGHASVPARQAWSGRPVGYENRIYSLDTVRDLVARAGAGEYIDSHVWLFTPGSFLEQVVELRTLGLGAWWVETLVPTKRNELEFYAVLRRLPRDGDWDPQVVAGEPPLPTIPDWLAETAATTRHLAEAKEQLAAAREEVARLTRALTSAHTTVSTLRARERSRPTQRLKAFARTVPGFATARRVRNRVRRLARRRTGR